MMKIARRFLFPLFLLAIVLYAPARAIDDYAMRRVRDATVMVCVETGEYPDIAVSWGSGMIIGPGLVATNAHVVNEKLPSRIYIQNENLPRTPVNVIARRYETDEFSPRKIVDYLANTLIDTAKINGVRLAEKRNNFDMAILAFDAGGAAHLPALAFNETVMKDERIVASGFPGQAATEAGYRSETGFTPGSVSPIVMTGGFVTNVGDREPQIIVHNAPCSTGNSGGPLVNARGEIVGMQTWTSVPGTGSGYMSLAIGARDMVDFLRRSGVEPMIAGYSAPRSAPQPAYDVSGQIIAFANGGDADFMALAGLLSFLGECGFVRDDRAAAAWLQRAVDAGGYRRLGYLYRAGLAAVYFESETLWQPEFAENLLTAANASPAAGSTEPDTHLLAYEASLRAQGKAYGIQVDAERSLALAERAMAGAFAYPYALAGFHYYFGDTHAGKDHEKALRYARESANNDVVEGVSLLAHLYYDSDAVDRTPANREVARRLARQAAAEGDPWAFGLLATMHYDSGRLEERAEALKLSLLGACHGNRLAMLSLGRMAWDSFASNTGDLSQAARAWAYLDLAGRQGVGAVIRNRLDNGRLIRSAYEMALFFPPEVRGRVVQEGRREQDMLLARRNHRPRIPCVDQVLPQLGRLARAGKRR